ncbi:hypothetical protein, partial [Klebsiella variicola]|uniref:hypothetical protein n=1 Tax=Klebsiella variicola TaxID=244366 RepID=UPI003D02873B
SRLTTCGITLASFLLSCFVKKGKSRSVMEIWRNGRATVEKKPGKIRKIDKHCWFYRLSD